MTEQIVPWTQQLKNSIQASQQNPTNSHAQLSTVRGPSSSNLQGRPACRTVNIRAFRQNKLFFLSDLRSDKANDIKHGKSHFAEICWYFPETKKQFRISGILAFYCDDTTSADMWASITHSERKWWTWPSPGQPRAAACDFETNVPNTAPPYFCVCALCADFVDVLYLELVPFMREKHVLKQAGGSTNQYSDEIWSATMVNP